MRAPRRPAAVGRRVPPPVRSISSSIPLVRISYYDNATGDLYGVSLSSALPGRTLCYGDDVNIIVFLAGIIDPKWPVSATQILQELSGGPELPRKLSPFDESALECALRLRDSDASIRVSALLVGIKVSETLLRSVAAFRPDRIAGLTLSAERIWDTRAIAQCLAAVATGEPEADLVLMGREFGDIDDGVIPPSVAEQLQWSFVGLAQEVLRDADRWEFMRERGELTERIRVESPVLASVTNDKRNRLRFPMIKNIAAAKKERFAVSAIDESAGPAVQGGGVALQSLNDRAIGRQHAAGRLLTGSMQAQATELAAWLRSRA